MGTWKAKPEEEIWLTGERREVYLCFHGAAGGCSGSGGGGGGSGQTASAWRWRGQSSAAPSCDAVASALIEMHRWSEYEIMPHHIVMYKPLAYC
uniref:Uncharacterized protein n=1 Tax=Oryza glumipatula TaxID=40148 RepID=A0A0D9ZSS1_9ORYZ